MHSHNIRKFQVKLGAGGQIDEHVCLGYPTTREIKHEITIIGENAIVRTGSIIYESSIIGNNLETGHYCIIREENQIGDRFSIWNHSVVDYGSRIGNNVKIHNHVYIPQFTTIEDNVFIAPGVVMANDLHPGCPSFRECMQGPTIKRGARIGAGAIILPWVVIGENALVGAGAVVTKNVPSCTIVYGNPAYGDKKITDLPCPVGIIGGPYKHLLQDRPI